MVTLQARLIQRAALAAAQVADARRAHHKLVDRPSHGAEPATLEYQRLRETKVSMGLANPGEGKLLKGCNLARGAGWHQERGDPGSRFHLRPAPVAAAALHGPCPTPVLVDAAQPALTHQEKHMSKQPLNVYVVEDYESA
ncbi:MAG: hypothetical protein ACTHOL_07735, partial [Luteibacter jiangsuensis]